MRLRALLLVVIAGCTPGNDPATDSAGATPGTAAAEAPVDPGTVAEPAETKAPSAALTDMPTAPEPPQAAEAQPQLTEATPSDSGSTPQPTASADRRAAEWVINNEGSVEVAGTDYRIADLEILRATFS